MTQDAGEELHPVLQLVAVMDRLRSPGGCPWDAEQTHQSLVEYLLEECFETIEAIETGDESHLREELGDLLLQVVFHSRIGEESADPWGIGDVASGIVAKLVSRHPHVFGGGSVAGAAEVAANWTELKRAEKSRSSALDGIPLALPALALVQKSWRRAGESGVPLVAPDPASAPDDEDALGEELLALAVLAERRGWDAESLLRRGARQLHQAIREAESGTTPGEG